MLRLFMNGALFWSADSSECPSERYVVFDLKMSKAIDDISTLEFSTTLLHPMASRLKLNRSTFVLSDDYPLFLGRVTEITKTFDMKINVRLEDFRSVFKDDYFSSAYTWKDEDQTEMLTHFATIDGLLKNILCYVNDGRFIGERCAGVNSDWPSLPKIQKGITIYRGQARQAQEYEIAGKTFYSALFEEVVSKVGGYWRLRFKEKKIRNSNRKVTRCKITKIFIDYLSSEADFLLDPDTGLLITYEQPTSGDTTNIYVGSSESEIGVDTTDSGINDVDTYFFYENGESYLATEDLVAKFYTEQPTYNENYPYDYSWDANCDVVPSFTIELTDGSGKTKPFAEYYIDEAYPQTYPAYTEKYMSVVLEGDKIWKGLVTAYPISIQDFLDDYYIIINVELQDSTGTSEIHSVSEKDYARRGVPGLYATSLSIVDDPMYPLRHGYNLFPAKRFYQTDNYRVGTDMKIVWNPSEFDRSDLYNFKASISIRGDIIYKSYSGAYVKASPSQKAPRDRYQIYGY